MASKRKGSLSGFAASPALAAATAAKGGKANVAPVTTGPRGKLGAKSGRDKTTAITLSGEHWDILRAVAAKRAAENGGRNSVSGVLGALIDDSRDALETEAGPFLKLYRGKS
jgi:hypothetical protein